MPLPSTYYVALKLKILEKIEHIWPDGGSYWGPPYTFLESSFHGQHLPRR